jgi:hypothetical protein
MRSITSRDAAIKGARDDDGRRVFPAREAPPPVDKHLAALERIGAQIQTLAAKPSSDPALRALLVELAAQTSAIAELVSALARQQQARPQPAPITALKITSRDYADRIATVEVVRDTP